MVHFEYIIGSHYTIFSNDLQYYDFTVSDLQVSYPWLFSVLVGSTVV